MARLDEVVGIDGWSYTYTLGERALSCALSIRGATKSAVVFLEFSTPEGAADDALIRAAERFGMRPVADMSAQYWVDYNAESGEPLFEPPLPAPTVQRETVSPPSPERAKPAGQQAIDRLLDRLKEEGLGLQAAKLIVRFEGYGSNPQAAKELYAELRALLLSGAESS